MNTFPSFTIILRKNKFLLKLYNNHDFCYVLEESGQRIQEKMMVKPWRQCGQLLHLSLFLICFDFFQPFYDSPYDYYEDLQQASRYLYLHQSQLNRNNNNSLSAESLTTVTPAENKYLRMNLMRMDRLERRLSSPPILGMFISEQNNETSSASLIETDSFV